MLFRRRQNEPWQRTAENDSDRPSEGGQSCPSLAKAVEHLKRKDRSRVLDLGPMCGSTVVYLAEQGARVTVEDFDPPEVPPPAKAGDPPPEIPPLRIDQPDGAFDLVLVWEQIDFVPPDRLEEFGAEVRRLLATDGWCLLLSRLGGSEQPDVRSRFKACGEDRLERQQVSEGSRPRWAHATRLIERALGGFSIKGIHLQRDQTREILAVKKKKKTAKRKPPKRAPRKGSKESRSVEAG